MALVIEDGSIVTGANSYISVDAIRTYALARGVTLSADDSIVEPMAIAAMDYLQSYRGQYKGQKVSPTQPLQWPRKNVFYEGECFPQTAIPIELQNAQAQLVIEVFNGFDLMPTSDSYTTKLEKVDVIEVQYSAGGTTSGQATRDPIPIFPKVDALLQPLLRAMGMLSALRA